MTLNELFSANGWSDEQEPWSLADDCEAVIEVNGEDLIVLCEDGVAVWTNSERRWSELDGSYATKTAERIYQRGRGGNSADAALFIGWMRDFWDVPEMALEAEAAEARIREELPETAEMPREVLCDYLTDAGHEDAELLRRHTYDIGD